MHIESLTLFLDGFNCQCFFILAATAQVSDVAQVPRVYAFFISIQKNNTNNNHVTMRVNKA